MVESEKTVDQRYIADGWLPLSKGWPDRAYVRMKDGKLEVRFVEIKSPSCSVSVEQEIMHDVLRSLGLDVRVEPPSKAPQKPLIPIATLCKMLEMLEHNQKAAQPTTEL